MNLTWENVNVEYAAASGESTCALSGLNLAIGSGESVAIIGPSGCGKSTTLRLAAGLMAPTAGRVLADGEETSSPRIGTALILQDFGLLPWKTVIQNAELGLQIHGMSRGERRQRAAAALEQVGLSGFEKAYPAELSGGMQQRLALARALAMDVDLLLMDEPLSALDALLREELQNTLLDLWKQRGYTQVLVTHSIEEAVFLGQRIVVMAPRPGRVVAEIANPEMGREDYRASEGFYARCSEVRSALTAGMAAVTDPAAQEASHA